MADEMFSGSVARELAVEIVDRLQAVLEDPNAGAVLLTRDEALVAAGLLDALIELLDAPAPAGSC